jgi:hypothetical protein
MRSEQRRSVVALRGAWRAARVWCAVAVPVVVVVALQAATSVTRAFAPDGPATLVVCAPGYLGSTAEAQPAMDALAAAVAAASGLRPADLKAVYFESERAGLDRLGGPDAALALVPLPFWLKHGGALKLDPQLQAVQQGGDAAESWSLVAPKGAVTGPAGLAGFEIISLAGYAPRFVRGPALGSWGVLPADVTITFSGAVLTGLRRASAGGKLALLLDREQAAAMPALPFAAKLEVVTKSPPLPVSVLCVVSARVPAGRLKALVKGFTALGATSAGAEALAGVRLARFVPADLNAIARARDAFERARD